MDRNQQAFNRVLRLDGGPGSGVPGHVTERAMRSTHAADKATFGTGARFGDITHPITGESIGYASHMEAAREHASAEKDNLAAGNKDAADAHGVAREAHEKAAVATAKLDKAKGRDTIDKYQREKAYQEQRAADASASAYRANLPKEPQETRESADRRAMAEHNQLHGFAIKSR